MKREQAILVSCGRIRPILWPEFARMAQAAYQIERGFHGRSVACDFRAHGIPSPWRPGDRVLEIPAGYRLAFSHPMDYLGALARGRASLLAFFDPEDKVQLQVLQIASTVCELEDTRFAVCALGQPTTRSSLG